MQDIIVKAGCFIFIIILGYVLRKTGFFREEDFSVLAKIVLKITLPAAIISSFAGKEIDPLMFTIAIWGLAGGVVYILMGYLLNIRQGKEKQSFAMLNISGYNIGNFTLPFVQSFLGPVGVITTSLFDVGNACICLGGSYAMASMVKDDTKFSIGKILKKLSKSVAFDCYVLMIILKIFHLSIPMPVVTCADIIGNANAFAAMLMLGVGFKLSGDKSQIKDISKILIIRYSLATILALIFYIVLPFDEEVRKALVILAFSPIASAAPAFTEELKGDIGLSSAVNSISIVISIIIIVCLLILLV